jgi:NTP pyrophosphatase (non-canonical NTP hydrolase)
MIELAPNAPLRAYQTYIEELEAKMGWTDVDLVNNCFLMGEEVGELFKAVRKVKGHFLEGAVPTDGKQEVAYEIVDVMNYLLAIANRLDIDVEQAFRDKNTLNQGRTWGPAAGGDETG